MMGGRVLQAIGAGVLMPLGSNVIVTIFPPEKRGVAMGTMGIAMILAPANQLYQVTSFKIIIGTLCSMVCSS